MLNQTEIERLRPISEHSDLFPIGGGDKRKAPGYLGRKIKWRYQPGHTIEELKKPKGHCAIGVRTAPNLFCTDFDGRSSIAYWLNRGLSAQDAKSWKIHRNNNIGRLKILFRPTPEQLEMLPINKDGNRYFDFSVNTGIAEQIEFFFSPGRQVLVLGQHYETNGQYLWYQNGPEQLSPPPEDWWAEILRHLDKHLQTSPNRKASSSHGRDWERLNNCPICGRDAHTVCSIHRDKKTVRCFDGATFGPPKGLQRGELIQGGEWAYSGTEQHVGWGKFAVFVRHKVSPLQQLRRSTLG